jgi:hypothetical protein
MTREELEDRYKFLGDIYRKRLADREYYQNELTNDENTRKGLAQQAKDQPDNEEVKNKLADSEKRVSDDKAQIKATTKQVEEARDARDEFREKHPNIAEPIDGEDRQRDQVRKDVMALEAQRDADIARATGNDPNAVPTKGEDPIKGRMGMFTGAVLAASAMWNANAQVTDTVHDAMQNENRPAIVRQHEDPKHANQPAAGREHLGENATDLKEGLENLEHKNQKPVAPPSEPSARQLADAKSQPPASEPDYHWTRY